MRPAAPRVARRTLCQALSAGLALVATVAQAQAPVPAAARIEISYLMGFIDGSACDFYRNGTWHTAIEAQAHLRGKYDYLSARGKIASAEDFIEKVATRSSLSGEAYAVRCAGGDRIASADWLRAALVRLRAM